MAANLRTVFAGIAVRGTIDADHYVVDILAIQRMKVSIVQTVGPGMDKLMGTVSG